MKEVHEYIFSLWQLLDKTLEVRAPLTHVYPCVYKTIRERLDVCHLNVVGMRTLKGLRFGTDYSGCGCSVGNLRHSLTLNISQTATHTAIVTMEGE